MCFYTLCPASFWGNDTKFVQCLIKVYANLNPDLVLGGLHLSISTGTRSEQHTYEVWK